MPLKAVLDGKTFIFVTRVEQLDAGKATMVLTIGDMLKGDFPHRKLIVDLRGDAIAQKDKQSPQLIERLAPNLELVVFGMTAGTQTTLYAFTNGTWFQLNERGDSSNYSFIHFEPYLRRTFNGTTAELKQVVADGLSGKKEPPPVDANEPPGIGPPVKK